MNTQNLDAVQMDSLDKMIVARVNGEDVTRKTLSDAFDMIRDPSDWRAPIDQQFDMMPEDVDMYCEAIRFFTATEPTVMVLSNGETRIKADGYRAGPAGP